MHVQQTHIVDIQSFAVPTVPVPLPSPQAIPIVPTSVGQDYLDSPIQGTSVH